MKRNHKLISIAALVSAMALSGWVLPACSAKKDGNVFNETDVTEGEGNNNTGTGSEGPSQDVSKPETPEIEMPQPQPAKAQYVSVTASGVNLRSGAGTNYFAMGTAEKNTLYAIYGRQGDWYMTYYKNKPVYINANYCTVVQMSKNANEEVEKVITEGYKYMGVTYVYGATRYHDGTGKKLAGFTTSAFDCSSLMQYMFKIGADVNLQVTTRTQVVQGKTVSKNDLQRGDLMFFTNSTRKDKVGVERIGHVALYLGNNYILHTASDYAKIEQISSTRWSYYIQSQRML